MEKKTKTKKFRVYILFLCIALLSFLVYLYIELKHFTSFLNFLPKLLGLVLILFIIVCFIISSIKNEGKGSGYIILGSLFLTLYSVFNSLLTLNIISLPSDEFVPNFINQPVNVVNEWKKENGIEVTEKYVYDDDVKKYYVIGQSVNYPTLTKDIKEMIITISNGPDYEKEIIIPSFIGKKYDYVIEYIEENYLSNVNFKYVVDEDKVDTIIDQVGSGSGKRNTEIVLTVATMEQGDIDIIDFTNKSEIYATSWLEKNGFKVSKEYEFSDKIEQNYVIKQEKEEDNTITLTISKGKEMIVPDISNMNTDDINKWIMENELKVSYKEVYNDDVKLGDVISSSKEKGASIGKGESIEIIISKGNLKMIEITDLQDFENWAKENKIDYEINYEYSSSIKKDEIIKSTHKTGDDIKIDDTIVITVSKGKNVTIPNFVGKSKSEITSTCNNLNISCSFKYGSKTEKTAKDIATSQSKNSGTTVSEGTNIVITLSSGIIEKVTVPDFTGKNKSNITSTCKSLGITCNFKYASGYSNTEKDICLNQSSKGSVNKGSTITITLSNGPAKTYTVIIDANQLSNGNPNATKSTLESKLKQACPGVTFKFTFQKANSGIGYLAQNSDVKVGSNKLVQGKTYNVIINSN